MYEGKIQPLGARVVVRPLDEDRTGTSGGLYMPEAAKERPQIGEVIAVGDEPGEIKVKVGQKVLFPKYTGTEIRLNGMDHTIIKASDLLAIITD